MYKYVIFLIIAWSTHHAAMSLEIYSDNNNHPAFISTACNGAIAIYHNKNQGGFYEKALHINSQYIDIKQHLLQETPGNCQLLAITYPSSTTNNNFAFIIRINENNCLHTVLFHDRSYQRVLVHLNDVLQKAVTDKSCIIPFLAWSHANQTLLHSCFKKSAETKNSIVTIDQERKTISYVDTNFLTTTLRFFSFLNPSTLFAVLSDIGLNPHANTIKIGLLQDKEQFIHKITLQAKDINPTFLPNNNGSLALQVLQENETTFLLYIHHENKNTSCFRIIIDPETYYMYCKHLDISSLLTRVYEKEESPNNHAPMEL